MEVRFHGKRALITGAGKGIGRAIAVRLAQCGAKIVAISRTQEDLDTLKEEVADVETDLCDLAEWDTTREIVESLGPIDLLVNNAALSCRVPFLEVTKDMLQHRFDVNFMAVFNITQIVAKGMIERGTGGAIVNISSIAAKIAGPSRSVYCCSKAALDQLTRSLAFELGPHKIRVNSVNATFVQTQQRRTSGWETTQEGFKMKERTPLGRIAEIDEVVSATMFLLSDQASMVTGDSLVVDGGLTIAM